MDGIDWPAQTVIVSTAGQPAVECGGAIRPVLTDSGFWQV